MSNQHEVEYELSTLRERYDEQLRTSSDLRYVTLSNIKFIEAKESYRLGNFQQATKGFQESMDALIENFKIVVNFQTNNKSEIILKTKLFLMDRARYLVSSYVIQHNTARDTKDLEDLSKELIKKELLKHKGFKLGKNDVLEAIQEGIIFTASRHPEKLYELAVSEDLFKSLTLPNLPKDRKLALKKGFYRSKLKTIEKNAFATPLAISKELAKINLELAKINSEEDTVESKQSYHQHHIDYCKFKCLSTNEISIFWKRFSILEKALDEYVLFEGESEEALRKAHLETAFALIHAMSIADQPHDKEEIARLITMSYAYAGSYNADRFRIYWDWYKLANKIFSIKRANHKSLSELSDAVNRLRSLSYKDRDESFLKKNLPDIVHTRNNIVVVKDFLRIIDKNIETKNCNSKILDAALVLYLGKCLDVSSTFEILKKFIETELKINPSPEPLRLFEVIKAPKVNPYLTLIRAGETDEIEFKETWRYDTLKKEVNKEVEKSALKAIASFMNTKGGTLFIGVTDAGSLSNINSSEGNLYKGKNLKDELRRQIDQKVGMVLGASAPTLVKITFDEEEEKTFAIISVQSSSKPVFMEDKLYIRRTASSQEITGPSLVQYCQEHFL